MRLFSSSGLVDFCRISPTAKTSIGLIFEVSISRRVPLISASFTLPEVVTAHPCFIAGINSATLTSRSPTYLLSKNAAGISLTARFSLIKNCAGKGIANGAALSIAITFGAISWFTLTSSWTITSSSMKPVNSLAAIIHFWTLLRGNGNLEIFKTLFARSNSRARLSALALANASALVNPTVSRSSHATFPMPGISLRSVMFLSSSTNIEQSIPLGKRSCQCGKHLPKLNELYLPILKPGFFLNYDLWWCAVYETGISQLAFTLFDFHFDI